MSHSEARVEDSSPLLPEYTIRYDEVLISSKWRQDLSQGRVLMQSASGNMLCYLTVDQIRIEQSS